ncbi:MAG: FAD-binding domain-containing protein [Wenzhouxiangellaceae bacterium]|nr:FAD-binding domain-containing protein [Wenzhouxiangellaceae bacterium]
MKTLPALTALFPASRSAALARLEAFAPNAGRHYARMRNTDPGPELRANVSMLSPYLRHRLIGEREVLATVLAQHSPAAAEKFIQEVCWRTYWKGWLQLRPGVWQAFLDERDHDRAVWATNPERSDALTAAESGRTGIECFDDWAHELVATGYLHNHARMWFASIWIFTLKLPWTLGADFFLRHLLDADPASNTLSWRWVAGIQTPGKTYLARADNIEEYTQGRYRPTGLATRAAPIRDETPPAAGPLPARAAPPALARALLLLHGDDLTGFSEVPAACDVAGAVIAAAGHRSAPWPFGDKAATFVRSAAEDAAQHARAALDCDVAVITALEADAIIAQARKLGADSILTPEAPVGPLDAGLEALAGELAAAGLALHRFRRAWDHNAWPHATRGFFAFRKRIPDLLFAAGLE